MTEEAEAAPDWLDRPAMLKRVIFVGGGLAALLALSVAPIVDLPGLLIRNSVAPLAMAIALVSALAASGTRYLFDRRRSRSGLPAAGYGRITYARDIFLLVQLGATGWLAVLSLTTWAIGHDIHVPAFQALILVLVGGVFISMTLFAIAHLAEMIGSALTLRPRVSPPGRGGP